MKNDKSIITIVVAFISVAAVMLYSVIYYSYKLDEEHPELSRVDSLNELIIYSKVNRGVVRFQTSTGRKLRMPFALNMNYAEDNICDYLIKGDSVLKKAGSDTIEIKRGNISYLFIANKVIEK